MRLFIDIHVYTILHKATELSSPILDANVSRRKPHQRLETWFLCFRETYIIIITVMAVASFAYVISLF